MDVIFYGFISDLRCVSEVSVIGGRLKKNYQVICHLFRVSGGKQC